MEEVTYYSDILTIPYGYIYKIVNNKNNKVYIGQSRIIKIKELKNYYGSGNLIKKAIKKYKKENFTKCFLITAFSKEELNSLEILYIKEYNSVYPNGYNLHLGGNLSWGVKGYKHTKEAKDKISEALRKRERKPLTEKTKNQIAKTLKGNIPWNKGKKNIYSKETLEKMSKSHIGNKLKHDKKCMCFRCKKERYK